MHNKWKFHMVCANLHL